MRPGCLARLLLSSEKVLTSQEYRIEMDEPHKGLAMKIHRDGFARPHDQHQHRINTGLRDCWQR